MTLTKKQLDVTLSKKEIIGVSSTPPETISIDYLYGDGKDFFVVSAY